MEGVAVKGMVIAMGEAKDLMSFVPELGSDGFPSAAVVSFK
jgi:hypothetical protein